VDDWKWYQLKYDVASNTYVVANQILSWATRVFPHELEQYGIHSQSDIAADARRRPGVWMLFFSDQVDRGLFDENPYSPNLTYHEAEELFAKARKHYRDVPVFEIRTVEPEDLFGEERTERVKVGTKRELSVQDMRRPLGSNTWLEKRDGDYAVKLYWTDVVTVHPDGTYTIQTGGWHTNVTRDRINMILQHHGLNVWSRRVRTGTKVVPPDELFGRERRIGQYETDWWVFRYDGKDWQPTTPVGDGVRIDAMGRKMPWLHRVQRFHRNPGDNVDRAYGRWQETMKLRKRWPFKSPPPHPMYTAQEIAGMERLSDEETQELYAMARKALGAV